jgi:hypothetical protein
MKISGHEDELRQCEDIERAEHHRIVSLDRWLEAALTEPAMIG